MINITLLILAISVLLVAIVYSYTMLVEVREIKKELENLKKKYVK